MLSTMEPDLQTILLPFVPMATLVAALVSLLREAFPKIDGWRVFVAAAVAALLVPLWMQARKGGTLHWEPIAMDAPVIWALAVGGTKWIQRMRDRPKKPEEPGEVSPTLPPVLQSADPDATPLPVSPQG